jgi:hypothetical protein
MIATGQRIPPDFEWNGFVKRSEGVLIDPQAAPRSMANVSFPNQGHKATQPLLAGSLDRKGKLMRKFDTSYYVVSPSKFLHQFSTDDDIAKDPVPEISLYLPDCVVGGLDGQKFNVKGKDVSKGKLGVSVSMSHEYQFKAHTIPDAQIWHEVLADCAGQVTTEAPISEPNSPAMTQSSKFAGSGSSETAKHPGSLQTHGITEGEKVMSPVEHTPASATAAPAERTIHDIPSVPAPTTGAVSGVEKKPGDY